MAGIDIMGGLNKAFLATVGAVAITAEKSQQAVEDLVKKGERTVQQGKSLNQELSRTAKEAAQETTDTALRTFLEHDLGVKPEVADEEACLMEHVLSADTMQRLIGYLERQGVEIPKD